MGLSSIAPVVLISASKFNPDIVPVRTKELEEMYTLSNKKPNTIAIYFDRGYGLFFNELLVVDYFLFKDTNDSFIQKFPEFTSYINALSQAPVTNLSNPMINGSWYQQPNFKNLDMFDPFYGQKYRDMNMNDWFLNSYRNNFGMFSKYGYSNFGILNAPYYDSREWRRNGNGEALQNDLQELWDNKEFYPKNSNLKYLKNAKFIAMDTTESCKSLGYTPTKSGYIDDVYTLKSFSAVDKNNKQENPNNNETISYGTNNLLPINGSNMYPNLRVSTEKDSTFLFMHFQVTHEKYGYVYNDSFKTETNPYGINYENIDDGIPKVTNNDNNNFLVSVWYSIQKLKSILDYLKNLPCDRPGIDNQYDNTNFYVISDHGNGLKGPKSEFIKVQKYLVENNMMTQEQNDYILNQYLNHKVLSPASFNTVFMRKPSKLLNGVNTKNNFDTFFDKEHLVVNSDLVPIFEYDVYQQMNDYNSNIFKKEFNITDSWYWNESSNSIYTPYSDDEKLKQIIDDQFTNNFLINPLNNEKSNINSRIISFFGADWKFYKNAKKYNLKYKHLYNPKYSGGIFNIKNFEKVEL